MLTLCKKWTCQRKMLPYYQFPPNFKFTKEKGNFRRKAMSTIASSTSQSQVENQEDQEDSLVPNYSLTKG